MIDNQLHFLLVQFPLYASLLFNRVMQVVAFLAAVQGRDFSAPSAVFVISFWIRPKLSTGKGVYPVKYTWPTPAPSDVRKREPTL
jgi:hypothetical protein